VNTPVAEGWQVYKGLLLAWIISKYLDVGKTGKVNA